MRERKAGEEERLKENPVQRSRSRNQLRVSAGAAGEGQGRGREVEAKASSPCDGVGHDKEFGLVLVAEENISISKVFANHGTNAQ